MIASVTCLDVPSMGLDVHVWLPVRACLMATAVPLNTGSNGAVKATPQRAGTPRVKNGTDLRPVPSAPLTAVVHDAVRRWFVETQKEAMKGDVVSSRPLLRHSE